MPQVEKTGQSSIETGREFYSRRIAALEATIKDTPPTSWEWLQTTEEIERYQLLWKQLERREESKQFKG